MSLKNHTQTAKSLRFIIGSLEVGGAERHLSFVLPQLKQLGWQVKIITLTPRNAGDLTDVFIANGIKVCFLPTFFSFVGTKNVLLRGLRLGVNWLRLWSDFLSDRDSITHYFLPQAYLVGAIAARCAFVTCPQVMSRRSLNNYQSSWKWFQALEIRLHRRMNLILANSEAVLRQLHAVEEVPLEKLGLIYNGVAIPSVVEPAIHSLPSLLPLKNHYLMTIVANLLFYKGHEDLLNALGLIKNKLGTQWRLLVVGRDAGILEHLKKIANQQGITNYICWLGPQNQVTDILSQSDLAILCSHQEGFSNAVLEAMACKLPLVVTDVGGNKEAVIDKECGLVVPKQSPKQLAEAILWMYEHQNEAQEMGRKAYERVSHCFSIDRCVAHYDDMYHKLKHYDVANVNALVTKQEIKI